MTKNLQQLSGLLLISLFILPVYAADLQKIIISVPGPHNLSYLPIELIHKIGADRAEGVEVSLNDVSGGAVALNELDGRNCDFAAAGLPAVMSERQKGKDVVTLAAIDDLPLFVLMVRSNLKRKIKRIRDLQGRVLGVNTSTMSSKTTSQQLLELVLKSDGLTTDKVRIIAAGQSWEEQSSLLLSGRADAIMGDEPFATRLQDSGAVFFLLNLGDAPAARAIPGAGFLHVTLNANVDLVKNQPDKAARMVAALRRTLQWIASHTPEQIADALEIADGEARTTLVATLKKYPKLYSRDGRFSGAQMKQTVTFFAASTGDSAGAEKLLRDMTVDRWAGRRE